MFGRSLCELVLALLFPDRCAGCRRLGALVCEHCRARLVPYSESIRRMPDSLSSVQIVFVYKSPLREMMHQLKYRRLQRVAQPLGVLLAAHLADQPRAIDAVLPIPLHAERLAARGFNQAEALAREVARVLQLPLIVDGLIRTRATEQQANLDVRGRAENVRGAFIWRSAVAPPPRVLLVDDVLTTGATMGACAEVLRAAGSEVVRGLALARSRPELQ